MAKKKAQIPVLQIVIGLVVIGLIIYFVRKRNTTDETTDTGDKNSSGSSSSNSSSVQTASNGLKMVGSNTTLKKGTKAAEVEWLQHYYNIKFATPLGKTTLTKDGIFGSKTEGAVKTIVGKNTTTWNEFKAKLDASNTPLSPTGSNSVFFMPSGSSADYSWVWQ